MRPGLLITHGLQELPVALTRRFAALQHVRSYRRLLGAVRLLKTIAGTRIGRSKPMLAVWETTYRCNMRCSFCNEQDFSMPELNTEQALDLVRQLGELGTNIILLTGGEPTLRPDFPAIMRAIAESGMTCILCTNGSHIAAHWNAVLKADLLRISVDGHGEAHDRIRGSPGAFARISECVPRLVAAGHAPMLATVVTTGTSAENLHRLLRQARAWGVQVELSMVVYSRRTAALTDETEFSSPRQRLHRLGEADLVELLTRCARQYPEVVANPKFYRRLVTRGGLGKQCRALDVSLNIRPDGSVSIPCDAFAVRYLTGGMREVWSQMQGMRDVKQKLGEYPFCRNCYKRCIAFPSLLLDLPHLTDLCWAYFPSVLPSRPRPRPMDPREVGS